MTNTPLGTIDGVAADGAEEVTLDVVDPATEEVVARVPISGAATVDRAVLAAEHAFDAWSESTPAERQGLLDTLAGAVMQNVDELARLEALDTGKPLPVARAEITASAAELRYFGGIARTIEGKAAAEYVRGRTSMIRRDPVGVVGQITPWNYPFQMAIWKIAPALAAGNTIVLKPSELTPLSTLRLGELAREILPPGVLNVVPGDGATTGDAIVRHPRVRMLCLTGDVGTGRLVAANAAANVKRVHLELGGKAPVIVFDDADLTLLAKTLRVASYGNAGQDCTAACRVLVADRQHDALLEALVSEAESLVTGGPFEDVDADLGPVISRKQQERVLGFVERAAAAGAEVVTGGNASHQRGWFVSPTVVANVAQSHEIVQREVFGPVVTVQRFSDEAEALGWANDVEYGLSASVWSRDLGRCLRMARKLQFGTVWLNDHLTIADEMPHGGFKQSGYGKDLSPYALEDYTVVKHVMARIE